MLVLGLGLGLGLGTVETVFSSSSLSSSSSFLKSSSLNSASSPLLCRPSDLLVKLSFPLPRPPFEVVSLFCQLCYPLLLPLQS
jgi:hypothetical protein